MIRPTCDYVKSDGTKCQSVAVLKDGSGMCWFHSDRVTYEERQKARAKGGKVKKYTGLVRRDFNENLAGDTKMVLIETINQLRDATIPPSIANSIIYGCSALTKIYELQDLEKRLYEIEKIVLTRGI